MLNIWLAVFHHYSLTRTSLLTMNRVGKYAAIRACLMRSVGRGPNVLCKSCSAVLCREQQRVDNTCAVLIGLRPALLSMSMDWSLYCHRKKIIDVIAKFYFATCHQQSLPATVLLMSCCMLSVTHTERDTFRTHDTRTNPTIKIVYLISLTQISPPISNWLYPRVEKLDAFSYPRDSLGLGCRI